MYDKKSKIVNAFKKGTLALVLFGIGAYLISVICGVGIISYESANIKEMLDNPYIDNEYSGWSKARLDQGYEILVPSDWEKTSELDYISFQRNGKIVAYVKVLNHTGPSDKELSSSVLEVEINEFSYKTVKNFRVFDGSTFTKYLVNNEKELYFLKRGLGQCWIVVIFTDIFESEENLIDIAQAIDYSAFEIYNQQKTEKTGDGSLSED